MTDERRAILDLCERIYRFHPNEDTMAEWIAAAIAARERAVWLEASKLVKDEADYTKKENWADENRKTSYLLALSTIHSAINERAKVVQP